MNLRPLFFYFTIASIICTLLGQMHWIIGVILTIFGLWCLIIADLDADAEHKRQSHNRNS